MRPDYIKWLDEQKYADNTKVAQINRVKKVEEHYGSLDENFANGTYDDIIGSLIYTKEDERTKKPNPSKIPIERGSVWKGLQSYKSAVVRYQKFLTGGFSAATQDEPTQSPEPDWHATADDSFQQRFSLERDMQAALRHNIKSLDPALEIIDDGAERAVDSGLIDITCDDGSHIVVVELKAGKADSRAIGQILGYMGDLQDEDEKPVRGILVAHDFDKRAKAAAKIVPALMLKRYTIEFKFVTEE